MEGLEEIVRRVRTTKSVSPEIEIRCLCNPRKESDLSRKKGVQKNIHPGRTVNPEDRLLQ